ncbi:NADPH-dependent FMN reductase [Saccharibacillus sp. CPCC 101409]|uniref:NADPH-dependent FMN reductase n=1 Tax=Saccharibacillus sp. CPCC 101409 TaxID=3058041 RepID=UPI0026728457|nr:NADPH-dependent FMN reductase [Saccharibacillus sp. CPCC 101409]MDO3413084.1 NADPH-dependent FMN reductase [Saccharibacillus sp. CPCC 101409]
MPQKLLIVSGSPNLTSRLYGPVQYLEGRLDEEGLQHELLHIAELPHTDLITANFAGEEIKEALRKVEQADAVVFASPVYKASYSGVLKTFLDLIPQEGLRDKPVLPLLVGGTIAHLLAIDYALKPVLNALSARNILGGVYAVDREIERRPEGGYTLSEEIVSRLERSLAEIRIELKRRENEPASLPELHV